MGVSRDDVRRVAALARIGLREDRVDPLVRELDGILGHMQVLNRVRSAGDEPAPSPMPLASDDPPSVSLERAREDFAPNMRDGFFLVPRLATHEDGAGSS